MITALQAERMCLVLYLREGHLYYEVHEGIHPEGTPCVEEGRYDYAPQLRQTEAISEALYNTALLTLPYSKVYIYYIPHYVHLIPQELYREEAEWLGCISGVEREELSSLAYPLRDEGQVLIGTLGAELIQFFARQYLDVEYIPSYARHFAPLLEASRQSGQGQMLIYLDAQGLSIAYCTDRHWAFINRYTYVSPWRAESKAGEVIYYLSLVLEALALSYEELRLHTWANEESEEPLQKQLGDLLGEALAPSPL